MSKTGECSAPFLRSVPLPFGGGYAMVALLEHDL